MEEKPTTSEDHPPAGSLPERHDVTEIGKRIPDLAMTDLPLDDARLKELQAKYAIRLQIADQILRDRELKLKEGTSKREKWTNPFTVALIVGAAGLIGTFFNGLWANLNEQTKLQNDLIKEAIKPASEQERAKSLVFFANNQLIRLEQGVIDQLVKAAGSDKPVPGSSGAAPTPASRPRALTPDELNGFVIHVSRTQVQRREDGRRRTIGRYRVTYGGQEITTLTGFTVESGGPGDNAIFGSGRRLEAGGYPLSAWDGSAYVTLGYSTNEGPDARPKPAIGVKNTGARSGILIHPGTGFLSALGTVNLSKALDAATANIDHQDSRQRVVALIAAMKEKLGTRFPSRNGTDIPNAWLNITGEPGDEGAN
jgi:hypothetical protein